MAEPLNGKATAAVRRIRRALGVLEVEDDGGALVGVAEAAEFLGVQKTKIWALLDQERMPAPIAQLTCGRIWLREELRGLRDELAEARARRVGGGKG